MGVTHTKLNHAMAEAIAVMLQAIRMGDPVRARTMGLVALATYAHEAGDNVSVESLLADADPGEIPVPESLRSRVPMMRIHNPADVRPEQFSETPTDA